MSMEPLGLPSIPTNRSSRMLKTSSSVVPCLAEALRAGRSRHTPRKVGDAGSEAHRTEVYASPLRSLRPCWTAFLSILGCMVPQFFLPSCNST